MKAGRRVRGDAEGLGEVTAKPGLPLRDGPPQTRLARGFPVYDHSTRESVERLTRLRSRPR
jgi:hypothetical protein